MGHVVGIEVGVTGTRAAVCRRTAQRPVWGPADPVVPGGPALGHLLALVGDDVPVLVGDRFVRPQAVVADLVRMTVDAIWAAEQEYPERTAVAHPTGWGPGRTGLLRAALDDAGTGDVALVARACAVTERFRAARRLPPADRPVAVCWIGAVTAELSLVMAHEPGRLEVLTSAEPGELGGDDLAVATPAEARGIAAAVVDLLRSTARSCELSPDDLGAVLLAGGGVAGQVLADVLAAEVAAPIVRDDDPRSTVACGAALSIRPPDPPAVVPAGPPAALTPGYVEPAIVTAPTGEFAAVVGPLPSRPPLHVAAPPAGRR